MATGHSGSFSMNSNVTTHLPDSTPSSLHPPPTAVAPSTDIHLPDSESLTPPPLETTPQLIKLVLAQLNEQQSSNRLSSTSTSTFTSIPGSSPEGNSSRRKNTDSTGTAIAIQEGEDSPSRHCSPADIDPCEGSNTNPLPPLSAGSSTGTRRPDQQLSYDPHGSNEDRISSPGSSSSCSSLPTGVSDILHHQQQPLPTSSSSTTPDPPLTYAAVAAAAPSPPTLATSPTLTSNQLSNINPRPNSAETVSIRSTQNDQDSSAAPLAEGAVQLNNKGLTSLPAELFDVMKASVAKLSLQANRLTALPPQIQSMRFLTYLDISHNKFTEFPAVLTKCPSLVILDISHNEIQRLPSDVGHLDSLSILSLSHNRFKYMTPGVLDMLELMVIQVEENPWVYPPKEIMQHPGAQAVDQTEWLELLRTYMEENVTKIRALLDREEMEQQQRQQQPQEQQEQEQQHQHQRQEQQLEHQELQEQHQKAVVAPSQQHILPELSPIASHPPHSAPAANQIPSAVPPASSNPPLPNTNIESTVSSNSTKPGEQQQPQITDIESLSSWFKYNDSLDEESTDRKLGISEGAVAAANAPGSSATQSSRAAKRMGFVVKKPARGSTIDGVDAARAIAQQQQAPPLPQTASSAPPAPSQPSSLSSTSAHALSSFESVSKSTSTNSLSSIATTDLNPASRHAYSAVPQSPDESQAPPLSAVMQSPPRKLYPAGHSHSREPSHHSINESIHSSIGSNSSSAMGMERLPSVEESTSHHQHSNSSSSVSHHHNHPHLHHHHLHHSIATSVPSSAATLHSITSGPQSSQPILISPSSSSASFSSLHHYSPSSNVLQPSPAVASRLRTSSHSSRERSHSLSVTSSPEKESASGAYFRRLSTLTEEIKPTSLLEKHAEYLEIERRIVVTARNVLFSLVEFQSILRRCTRLCNDKTVSVTMSELLYSGQSYNDNLVRALEQEETRTRAGEEISMDELQTFVKKITQTCITSMKHFRQMAQFCNENLFGFTSHIDVKFIRCLVLVTFGSFNELFNSWNLLNDAENPPTYPTQEHAAPPLHTQVESPASYMPMSFSRSETALAYSKQGGHHPGPLAMMPGITLPSQPNLSSPTTPSGPAPPQFSIHRGASAATGSSPQVGSFAEADEALYYGLEAAASAAKTLLRQLTETLSKESANSSKTPNASVTTHVKNLSQRCIIGVEVTQKLKERLENIRKVKQTTVTASTGGTSTPATGTSGGLFAPPQLDLVERKRFWDDMNTFVKGIIGLLGSTKSAFNDLPYLKNTPNLATLSKITKDIPPLMEASSYKFLIAAAPTDLKDHSQAASAALAAPTSDQPTQTPLSAHPSFISIPAAINTNFAQSLAMPSVQLPISGGPLSGSVLNLAALGPATGPPSAVSSSSSGGHHDLTSPTSATASGGQFFPPTTPLSAVLGPAAAAVAMPSPPISKTFSSSPFFPPHASIPDNIALSTTTTTTANSSAISSPLMMPSIAPGMVNLKLTTSSPDNGIDANLSSFSLGDGSSVLSPSVSKTTLVNPNGPHQTYFPSQMSDGSGVNVAISPSSIYMYQQQYYQNPNSASAVAAAAAGGPGGLSSVALDSTSTSNSSVYIVSPNSSSSSPTHAAQLSQSSPNDSVVSVAGAGVTSARQTHSRAPSRGPGNGHGHGRSPSNGSVKSFSSNATIGSSDGVAPMSPDKQHLPHHHLHNHHHYINSHGHAHAPLGLHSASKDMSTSHSRSHSNSSNEGGYIKAVPPSSQQQVLGSTHKRHGKTSSGSGLANVISHSGTGGGVSLSSNLSNSSVRSVSNSSNGTTGTSSSNSGSSTDVHLTGKPAQLVNHEANDGKYYPEKPHQHPYNSYLQ